MVVWAGSISSSTIDARRRSPLVVALADGRFGYRVRWATFAPTCTFGILRKPSRPQFCLKAFRSWRTICDLIASRVWEPRHVPSHLEVVEIGLFLATRNTTDFGRLGMALFNPWSGAGEPE
jgi:hypothetical protein